MIAVQTARAGDGTFSTTDGINGTFDFCVVIQFNATPTQLEFMRRAFQRGSDVLADATEGHHRFGKVNIVNNCGNGCAAAASAEWFVINKLGVSGASSSPGGFGVHNFWGQFAITEFDAIAFDQPGTDVFLNAAGFTIAHEFAHQAYNVDDEYSGVHPDNRQQRIGLGANCAPGVGPGAPPMDDPNLNYCLMDYFGGRGGMSVGNNRRITLKEFCVASNHDPDRNNNQSLNHQGMSCWETIFHLNKLWRLPSFPGLPNPIPPPSQPVTFGISCGDQKVVLLIDRSGSMTDESRLDFAKLGATLFIKDLRSDGYLGLVSFSDDVRVDFSLAKLVDDSTRNTAVTAVNSLVAGGSTDIGDGLISALGQLTGPNDCSSCAKTIILLTDGDHNTGTPPDAVTQQLKNAKVRLTAVVIGNAVSVAGENSLKNITSQTGGDFYRLPASIEGLPGSGPSGLQALFLHLANEINGDSLMGGQRSSIASGQVREIPISFEEGVAVATFAVTKADLADNITLSLRSPSGNITGQSNSQAVESFANPAPENADSMTLSNSQLIRIANPQPGTWTMIITAGSIRTGSIETMASADHLGVRVNVTIGNENTIFYPDPVEVHATPFFEASRTVGASLSATAKRPDGSNVSFNLFDDGLPDHGDLVPNDGIYSARFNDYSVDGTYVFDVTATNVSGRTYEGEFSDPSSSIPVPAFTRKGTTTAVISGVASGEAAWVEDSLSRTGGTAHGDSDGGASGTGQGDNWYWVNANPAPFSGTLAHQSTIRNGFHQHYFEGSTNPLLLNTGDKLFAYVFLDPNKVPNEIMLQWNDGNNWEHRACWGENLINFGIDGTASRRLVGPLPVAGQWVRLEVPASSVGLEGSAVTGMSFSLYGGRATWDSAGRLLVNAPLPSSADFVLVDDAVPTGSILETDADWWEWLEPHFSGTQGHRSYFTVKPGAGQFRSHSFRNSPVTMNVRPGDVLFTYVFLDSLHMPDELILQWHDGSGWEHRAFWGQNFYDLGRTGSESRRYMGGLPPGDRWVRLEVPASYVGLEGKVVSGMAYGFYSAKDQAGINWDYSGKSSLATQIPVRLSAITPVFQIPNGDKGVTYSTSDRASQSLKFYSHPNQAAATVPFYRFARASSGISEKFFSQCLPCYDGHGWVLDSNATDKGIAFYVYADGSTPGTVPLYLYHDNHFHYLLTTDQNEANSQFPDGIWAYVFATNPLVPVAPSNLILGFRGQYVDWQDNSFDETGFKIEMDNNDWLQVGTVGANIQHFVTGNSTAPCEGPAYRVRAYNSVGNSSYSNVASPCNHVGNPPDTPPEVSITSPNNGETVSANFTITANAFDSEGAGTIAKVEFFADSNKLGELSTPPYALVWTNPGLGNHFLTAKATDVPGAATTSAAIAVTVSNPPGSAQIVFASNRDGNSQLYSMNSDGSGQIRLTNNLANDDSPRWSPNYARIIFQSDRINPFCGVADIYVMNIDGSGQTQLTADAADDSAPVWSPDGTKIAFQSARNGLNYQVYVMNADGSGQTNISNSTANEAQPSWSPDGTKIAFTSDRDHPGKTSIYVMNANGSNQTRLTFSGSDVIDDQPVWSPDGYRIAFVSTRDSVVETWQETDDDGGILTRTRVNTNKEVYLMNSDGTNQLRLINSLGNDDSPVWCRDGTKLLFRSDRERDCCDPMAQIWVMYTDGSNQLNLSNSVFNDFGGSW